MEESGTKKQQESSHAIPGHEVAERLGVEPGIGLSNEDVNRRLSSGGINRIEQKAQHTLWQLLHDQFSSIVIFLLGFAAIVALLTGNQLEAFAIFVVMLINAAIGFWIEWQAGRALEALRKSTRITARVRRNGHQQVIDAETLVAGDILIFSAGDRVPADTRILESANLRTDESTLTGESVSVEKDSAPVLVSAPLAERRSMLYLGTTIVAGNASGIVTATGKHTELGRIGQMVAQVEEGQTPLQRRLGDLGRKLVYIVLGIALIVYLAGIFRGDDIWLMLEISISLAVAAVPEGLPAVTTLILAFGVLRMARQNAIVRRLAAVETLGSATVICTDKTGTLTENLMTVREYHLANDRVIGFSRANESESADEWNEHLRNELLTRLLLVSILCNEASFDTEGNGDQPKVIGDPTETALLMAAKRFGMDVTAEQSRHQNLYEVPFDSATRRMITVLKDNHGYSFAAIKGAPAVVLKSCKTYLTNEGETVLIDRQTRERFLEINREMADRALRVLAFADKRVTAKNDFSTEEIENDYTFLGFVGITDPPRIGVAEAVTVAQKAGIRVVMLTGDQTSTACAVARQLNLSEGAEVVALHSSDLAEAGGGKIADMARRAHLFSRVSPEDKYRIVRALQAKGEIVAVTGDGVNDAPALKQADIGIAMGGRGTEVAKEASDIVLTDDDFSTIVTAIERGRTIYANIHKFVHLMFSHNLGEVLMIFTAVMAGLPLPLLPLQILWINLVTDVFPALALALEPPSPETMNRKPRSPSETMLSKPFMFLIFWQGAMLAAIALAAYLWALREYGEGRQARTVAMLALVGVQLGHFFNCRSTTRSVFRNFFSNPYIFVAAAMVIALQALAVYFPPLARILDTAPPNKYDLAVIGLTVILPVIIVEIYKFLPSKRSSNELIPHRTSGSAN